MTIEEFDGGTKDGQSNEGGGVHGVIERRKEKKKLLGIVQSFLSIFFVVIDRKTSSESERGERNFQKNQKKRKS